MTSGPSSTSSPPTTPARPRPATVTTRRPSADGGGRKRTPPDGSPAAGSPDSLGKDCVSAERCQDRARSAAELERRRRRLNEAEQAVARIPDVERTIKHRSDWILRHPAELSWEAELAARLGEATAVGAPVPDREQTVADYDLKAALNSIDLRTIDLSSTRRRTGIERQLREALGIRPKDPIDIPHPPLPGRGLDGPDLGL